VSCTGFGHKPDDPQYIRVKAAVLPLCKHFVCHACITRHYDTKGSYGSCIACLVFDSLICRLGTLDALQPTLPTALNDLLCLARNLPPTQFSNQPISIDRQEAIYILETVRRMVAGNLGSESRLETNGLRGRVFHSSLVGHFEHRKTNEVTTTQDLRSALLNVVVIAANKELTLRHGPAWLKHQIGHRKPRGQQRYEWHESMAAFQSNGAYGADLGHVLQAWGNIVRWVVAILVWR